MDARLAVIGVAVLGLGYLVWHRHAANVEAAALAALTDENGFIALAQPAGITPDKVFIFAPANCPREAGRRSDALTQSLADRGVAYSRSAHLAYEPMDQVILDRVNAVIAGDNAPIVFVNGRIKANPTLEEVLAEYETTQR